VIQKGARVFFADNSVGYARRCETFGTIARSLGLHPALYGGVGEAVRRSNQDEDIRGDFWEAQAIVLYFGAPNDNSSHEDHWVLPEISHRVASGVDLLVYVSDDFPLSILQRYGYTGQPKVLTAGDDFAVILRTDLAGITSN
jgi:hypothetical protein